MELLKKSIWSESQNGTWPKLRGREETQVLVIGGGVAGTSAFYHLHNLGVHATLLEKGRVGSGAAGNSGGLLLPGVDEVCFHELVWKKDLPTAKRIYEATTKSIKDIERLQASEGIGFGLRRADGYYFAESYRAFHKLEREYLMLRRHGLDNTFPAELLRQKVLAERIEISPSINGAILYPEAKVLDPQRFVSSLAEIGARTGKIYENSGVIQISKTETGFLVKTEEGEVTTNQVVVATEASTRDLGLPIGNRLNVKCDILFTTEPIESEKLQGSRLGGENAFWAGRNHYLFVRTTKENQNDGPRFMISPMTLREEKDKPIDSETFRSATGAKLSQLFPLTAEISFSHAVKAKIAGTEDLFPFVGEYEGLIYSVGFNAQGLALGFFSGGLAARTSANRLELGDKELLELFSCRRE